MRANLTAGMAALTFLTLPAAPAAAQQSGTKSNAFFAFCVDTHDAKKRNLEQQAAMLKELGYAGVGHLWLDNIAERLKTLDAAGLRLFQITMTVDISKDKDPFDQRFKEVMPLLKGRQVQFALLMQGMKPSDPAGDQPAVRILRQMADLAQPAGAELLLYPHTGDWIERIEDAVRIAEKVDRPNVGVMFNLCHWLRVSKDRNYRAALAQAKPLLRAVSLNGADELDPQPGWSRYIQPLGRGSFDMPSFLKTLSELGYAGPIGLQCYGIPGDVQEHLAESMKAWRSYHTATGAAK
jgi:sugar phosphate isomerase/epimerase